jgi:hypothetical protein
MRLPLLVVGIFLTAAVSPRTVDAALKDLVKRKHTNKASDLYTVTADDHNNKDVSAIKDDNSLNALWYEGTDLEFGGERFLSDLSLSMNIPPRPPPLDSEDMSPPLDSVDKPPPSDSGGRPIQAPSEDGPIAAPSEDRPPSPTAPSISTEPTTPGACLDGTTEEDYLLSILSPITAEAVLKDPATPQGQAFAFILEDEAYDVCVPTIYQRYGLSTLYYATDGENWVENVGWVEDGEDECEWYNITCEEGLVVAMQLGKTMVCMSDCIFCTTGAHTTHLSHLFQLRVKQPRRYPSR